MENREKRTERDKEGWKLQDEKVQTQPDKEGQKMQDGEAQTKPGSPDERKCMKDGSGGTAEETAEKKDRKGARAGDDDRRPILRGELALLFIIVVNSAGVLFILHSGSGISAVSSVPYAFREVFPVLTLGTWTYLFQGLLVGVLMLMRKRFVLQYMLSFVVGFAFGIVMDLNELWIERLPLGLPLQVLYFVIGYCMITVGIAVSNRCRMPIIPTDLFPRELSLILKQPYSHIKIPMDVLSLTLTALITFFGVGEIRGLGVGTVIAAFTIGKAVGVVGKVMDRYVRFTSVLDPIEAGNGHAV